MVHTTGTQLTFFILFAAGICLQGCASVQSRLGPDTTMPLSLRIDDKLETVPAIKKIDAVVELGAGDKDTPSGIIYAPMGRVVLLGSSQSSSTNKDLQREKENLTLDLVKMAKASLRKEWPGPNSRYSLEEDPERCLVRVIPAVYLGFTDKEKARLWIHLWRGTNSGSKLVGWTDCSYIVGVGEPRPIRGRDGWISRDRQAFKDAVAEGFRLAFRTMFEDLDGKLWNEEAPVVTIKFPSFFGDEPEPEDVQILRIMKDGTMVRNKPTGWFEPASIMILPRDFPIPLSGPDSQEPSEDPQEEDPEDPEPSH